MTQTDLPQTDVIQTDVTHADLTRRDVGRGDAQVHQTEVDGVRCFWVDTGRPTLTAQLSVRTGMADEPLHEAGWQHLLEHLALHDRERPTLEVNGRVDLLDTCLQSHGPAELVGAHLGEVTSWLADPDFSQLDRERRVLRAESGLRGSSNQMTRALTMRYGARGPGVAGYGQPALGRATPELLNARIASAFTRGNAVLVLDGAPPAGLRLHLPDGPAAPWPSAVPCEETLPARYYEQDGLIVSGVADRSVAMTLAAELLRIAMTEQFRNTDGSAYAPWAHYQPVDADHVVLLAGTDLRPESRGRVARTALELVGHLRHRLPGRLADLQAARLQTMVDPYHRLSLALYAAREWQRGREPLTLDAMLEEMRAVTESEVLAGLGTFCESLLLGLPEDAVWTDQLPTLRQQTHAPRAQGRSWRSQNWPSDRSRLVVGATEVEARPSGRDAPARSVTLPSLAGMLVLDNGVRHLVGADGYGLTVDTRRWQDPAGVRAALDAAVPEPLHLPMPTSPEADEPPRRLNLFRRWTGAVESRRPGGARYADTWALMLLFTLLAAIEIVLLVAHAGAVSPALILIAVLGFRIVMRMRGKRGW